MVEGKILMPEYQYCLWFSCCLQLPGRVHQSLGKIWPMLLINFLLFCIFELKMPVGIMRMFQGLLAVGSTCFLSSPSVQTLLKGI